MSDSRDLATDDADLAIIRFHRWALGFAGPRRHWVPSAVRLGLIAVVTALAINVAVMAARISFNHPISPTRESSLLEMAFGIVLFAPLVETALLVLIYKMTKPYLGIGGFALVNTTLFGLAHIPTQGIPVGAISCFS